MPRAPRNGLLVEVAQGEFAGHSEGFKAVGDRELVVVGVGEFGFGVGDELSGKATPIEACGAEFTLAGDAMHRNGPTLTVRAAPVVELSLIEAASTEGEEDGIATAHLGETLDRFELRPIHDVPHRAVPELDVPIHETCALFRDRKKSRGATFPPIEGMAEVLNCFHRAPRNSPHVRAQAKGSSTAPAGQGGAGRPGTQGGAARPGMQGGAARPGMQGDAARPGTPLKPTPLLSSPGAPLPLLALRLTLGEFGLRIVMGYH